MSTSHTAVVRPLWRRRAVTWIVPCVTGRRKLVWLEIAVPGVPRVASASAIDANTPPWTSPSGCLSESSTGSRARISPPADESTSSCRRFDTARARYPSITLGPMAPPSAPLAGLAADKRAAVELVLRRGLSYGELAALLAVPEDTIRERARAGLEAPAPAPPPPPRPGETAAGLPGQQPPPPPPPPRTFVPAAAPPRHWAGTVAIPLRELSEDVPDLD